MGYKILKKMFYDNDTTYDYGYLSEEEIKAQTRGFKEIDDGVFTRKNCSYFYITLD